MDEQEYQDQFNNLMGIVMTALEISGNEALKKTIKRAMFDFSDAIRERVFNKGERENEPRKQRNF